MFYTSFAMFAFFSLQLADPLGYDQGLADNFASLTSSCNSKQYTYAAPTTYGGSDTAPGTATTSPSSGTWMYGHVLCASYRYMHRLVAIPERQYL